MIPRPPNYSNLLDDSCLNLRIGREFAANLLEFVHFAYFVIVTKLCNIYVLLPIIRSVRERKGERCVGIVLI